MERLRELHRTVGVVIEAVRSACSPEALVEWHLDELSTRSGGSKGGFAVGKAAPAMARAVRRRFEHWFGLVIAPQESIGEDDRKLWPFGLIAAAHPLPDEASRAGGARARVQISYCDELAPPGLLVLLSGGASSLMIDPPLEITVEDYRSVVLALLRSGAPIGELNAVRKHIDRCKGGGLARHCEGMDVEVLVLSDVIGNDLSVIGSGPFYPDPTTYGDAWDVLLARSCLDAAPAVTEWISAGMRGEHPESPKPGDPTFDRVRHTIIGANGTAIDAAAAALGSMGLLRPEIRRGMTGEAAEIGRLLAAAARAVRGPRALIWGGETTVTVGSAKGMGGRNQELALAAAIELEGVPGVTVATFGTDGVDGPTDAAGAIVTGETCRHARALGLDARGALASHDSYGFFSALDRAGLPHLIRTGPTGTNVNDLAIALVG